MLKIPNAWQCWWDRTLLSICETNIIKSCPITNTSYLYALIVMKFETVSICCAFNETSCISSQLWFDKLRTHTYSISCTVHTQQTVLHCLDMSVWFGWTGNWKTIRSRWRKRKNRATKWNLQQLCCVDVIDEWTKPTRYTHLYM